MGSTRLSVVFGCHLLQLLVFADRSTDPRIRTAIAATDVRSREAGPAGPHLPTLCYPGSVIRHSISSGTLNSPARSAQCQHTISPVLNGACVVTSSMSPHSSHSCNGSPAHSASLRSIHPLSVLRISCLLLSLRSSGGFALRSGSAADAVIAGGRVRVRGQGSCPKRNRLCLMIFFAALDLGRPSSKVSSDCGGTWSEHAVERTDRVKYRRRHRRGACPPAARHPRDRCRPMSPTEPGWWRS